jgi:hypothetical protein
MSGIPDRTWMASVSETLFDLPDVTGEPATTASLFNCPQCGSFLDAPRAHPASGEPARKCSSCRDWYRVMHAGDRAR